MKCPNCGKEVKEGAKFCVGCGTSLIQEATTTEAKENVESQKKTEVKEVVNKKVNEVKENVKKAANSNFMKLVLATLMFLFNILLKPMKYLKEKIEFYSNPKNGCILAGVLALASMIIKVLMEVIMALIDRNCVSYAGSKICGSTIGDNFKHIDWMGITLKHLLLILIVMFAISGIYYIASLVAKKSTNFFRLLTITVVSFVPYCLTAYFLCPFFGWVNGHIGLVLSIIGMVYSLVIFFSAIKDEIKFTDNDKNVYFHLTCASIILIVAYVVIYNVVINAATNALTNGFLNF